MKMRGLQWAGMPDSICTGGVPFVVFCFDVIVGDEAKASAIEQAVGVIEHAAYMSGLC